jgi:hypothetical protein
MKNQAFAVIATIALFVCFIFTLSPASANQMVVDVFIINQFPIPVSSITITHFVPVDIYAQVSYVQSGTMPPSDFQWYVNGEPTKFESASNSVHTFTPQANGKYVITVTVNGETNSKIVTVTVVAESTQEPASTPSQSPTSTPIHPPIPDRAEYTLALNETHDFEVTAGTNASIQWYLDDVLVKSEYASHSTYTFVANSPGVHWIKYSVYGFNLCIPKKVTVLAQPLITQTETPALTNSPLPIGSSAQPNSIPIQLITTVILVLVIACSGTLLYIRHRKPIPQNKSNV